MLRPRFSLLTLLLLTALIAGGVAGWLAYERRDRTADALQLIEKTPGVSTSYSTLKGKPRLELTVDQQVDFASFNDLARLLNRSVFRDIKLCLYDPQGDWVRNSLLISHQLELCFTNGKNPPIVLNRYLNQHVTELRLTTISFLLDTTSDPAPQLSKLSVTNCEIELQGTGICFGGVRDLEFSFDGRIKGGTRAQLCGKESNLASVYFYHVNQLASDKSLCESLASRKIIQELAFHPIRPGGEKMLEALDASACRVLEIGLINTNSDTEYQELEAQAEVITKRIMDRSKN